MIKKHYLPAMVLLLMVFSACEIEEDDTFTDLRDKYTGTWQFNENEAKNDLTFYNVVITKDPGNTSQVLLKNFGNVSNLHSAYGIVTTSRITVPSQDIASVTISGSGNLESTGNMSWTYSLNDGADIINYTAQAQKQ